MIPKIIHYCWLSKDPIPEAFQEYVASWYELMPDYEFMKWDFSCFDINSSIWVKEAFENKKYAFATDYIRLFALYNYGGFYLDMDVEVLKRFDPMLDLKSVLGWQHGKEGLEVAAFGVEKKSRWIKYCLEYYHNRSFILDDGKFDLEVLPNIVHKTIVKTKYSIVDVDNIKEAKAIETRKNCIPVFSESFFSPKSYSDGKIYLTKDTYCIHHFDGSWVSKMSKLKLSLWRCSPYYIRKIIKLLAKYKNAIKI